MKATKKLINSANKNNVRILVAHQRRFNSKINITREIIQAGDWGGDGSHLSHRMHV